ncbi:MAG: molybdenum cofactor biosynthesis protein MoaE [Planctomycetes bacterium]|nr:molybdenum cofactor biosynthesis protein MoaE [Planctomycetota bacterium]
MDDFQVTDRSIDLAAWRRRLDHPQGGGLVIFEGVVRDHHQGRAVRHLDYQGYAPLAVRTGQVILTAARSRWPLLAALGCHRTGHLEIGEAAVWIGTAAAHRAEAFAACAWIMDEVKARVPVWKRETFADGAVEWSQGTILRTEAPE